MRYLVSKSRKLEDIISMESFECESLRDVLNKSQNIWNFYSNIIADYLGHTRDTYTRMAKYKEDEIYIIGNVHKGPQFYLIPVQNEISNQ